MSTTNPTHETVAIDEQSNDLEKRDIAALTTPMTTMTDVGNLADGEYEVTTDSGSAYVVDPDAETCTCPDHEYRNVRCKHIRRVRFETGRDAIPGWVTPEALDDQLGMHIDESPRVAMTDGGMQAAEASADAPETETDSDPRDDYIVIGTDTDGCDHIYRTTDETVHVVEDGERVWVQDLDPEDEERNVNAWIGHIEDRRGFERQNLYQTMGDALMGAL